MERILSHSKNVLDAHNNTELYSYASDENKGYILYLIDIMKFIILICEEDKIVQVDLFLSDEQNKK